MEILTLKKFPLPYYIFASIKKYIELNKPRSVALLVFTSLVSMYLANQEMSYPPTFWSWIKNLFVITLACSGLNAVSCYVDKDIDASMERTKKRPLPSGRIFPAVKALYWGTAQFIIALLVSWTINVTAFCCILSGLFSYIVVYSLWLKRITPWNIIIGGISGGLPVLFGWMAFTGEINIFSLLVSLLVILWIPNHIWNLAIYFRDDYRRVNIPMLPVVCNIKTTLVYILITVLLMIADSIAVFYYGNLGFIYLWVALVCGVIILAGNIFLFFGYKEKKTWLLYKISSPYLFLLFLGMLLDKML